MQQLFLTYIAASLAAASTGVIFKPGLWYEALVKPGFTPARWAFPVVWTVLYLLSAYAAARLALLPGSGDVLALWSVQIALNTLWTPVFFGAHRMGLGMVVIVLLWLSILGLVVLSWPLDALAALIFQLYLIWVSIASALNWR
ncbi:tryptophan-rich sensory protein, partial [Thioclava sp. BHET1]